MNFIEATVLFLPGQLEEFPQHFEATYVDPKTGWSAIHWDDAEHTRVREASFSKGTIVPAPHYDAPFPDDPAELTYEWKLEHYDGDTVTCGWPEEFLDDLRSQRKAKAAILILALLQPMQAQT